MPIRWGPSEDQTLLLKILEVHPELNLDVNAVAGAWPAQEGEQAPTPRAIRERLVKIRNGAKKAGNTAHFSIGRARPAKSSAAANGVKPAVKGAPIPATPRKRKPSTVIKTESTDNGQSVTDDPESYPTPESFNSQGATMIPQVASTYHPIADLARNDGKQVVNQFSDSEDENTPDAYARTEKVMTRGNRLDTYQSDEGEAEDSSVSSYAPSSL